MSTLDLDCRGLPCPLPIIELAKHFHEIEVGQIIAVLSEDVAARIDVPAWCRMKAQEFVGEETAEDGTPRYLVRRLS